MQIFDSYLDNNLPNLKTPEKLLCLSHIMIKRKMFVFLYKCHIKRLLFKIFYDQNVLITYNKESEKYFFHPNYKKLKKYKQPTIVC